jgi:hypothetical protein
MPQKELLTLEQLRSTLMLINLIQVLQIKSLSSFGWESWDLITRTVSSEDNTFTCNLHMKTLICNHNSTPSVLINLSMNGIVEPE